MERGNSRAIDSNQSGIHPSLATIVRKHLDTPFQHPVAPHNRAVFETLSEAVNTAGRPLILDAGCGTGDSTRELGIIFPDHLVIGIDRSAHRLGKERATGNPANIFFSRMDLVDFYLLASEAGWKLERHYILYPNPYPKAEHFKRRWHGAPVFPYLLKLGGQLELRTNWEIYAREFFFALQLAGYEGDVRSFTPEKAYLSLFERKYHQSGQRLWRVDVNLAI